MTLRILLALLFAGSLCATAQAQAPQRFSYQAILRATDGTVNANTAAVLGLAIRSGTPQGTVVYAEQHSVTSNGYGLVNVSVGGGSGQSGSMAGIDWAAGPYFIEVSVDGSVLGTTQLLSVPYALYAEESGTPGPAGPQGAIGPQGATGAQGPAGATGAQGPQGVQGPIGATGPPGATGATGPQGPPGEDGTGNAWGLEGSAGTVTTTNYIGTSDAQNLRFGVNGVLAGRLEWSGNQNTSLGYRSILAPGLSGTWNSSLGFQSLQAVTTGYSNAAVGYETLQNTSTGFQNSAMGDYALRTNTSGNRNAAVGVEALHLNTTGSSNVAVGPFALRRNTVRSNLVAVGDSALFSNGVGASGATDAVENTAVGSKALAFNTVGSSNVALGFQAMRSNTNGTQNVAIGTRALWQNTTSPGTDALGNANVAVGFDALGSNTLGYINTALGHNALFDNLLGAANTALGQRALENNTLGDNNVGVGVQALGNNTSGDHNVALGNLAGFVGPSNFFCTFIGESAYASNSLARDYATTLGADSRSTNGGQVRIGSSAVGSIGGPQSWTTVSDARFKNGVREDVPGLPFILGLRPVTYHLATHELAGFLKEDIRPDPLTGRMVTHTPPQAAALREEVARKRQTGFLAQEVEAHAKQLGYAFSGVDAAKNDGDLYGLRYAEFVVPLVKAVQEQQEEIEEQRQRIERLEEQLKQVLDGR